jgi:hypothetical protein
MKGQVLTPLILFFSGTLSAQSSAFNVVQAGTLVEYRESFQMVPFMASGYGYEEPAELAMGGFDGTAVTASAEIGYEGFDADGPGIWLETQPMGQARMDFQAETSHSNPFVGDGVWVFGGFDGTYTLASTEVFVAAEESWQPGPDMLSPRTNHRSAQLGNGQILITGGFDGLQETASCEVFDPLTQQFSAVASMNVGRASHTLTDLGGGLYLAAGGFNAAAGFQLASCEVYDANANTWTEIDPLPVPVDNHAATRVSLSTQLPDVVMVTGGRIFNPALNLFEGLAAGAILNLDDMTWTPFDMASPHSYHLSTHLDPAAPELFVMSGADQTGIGIETTYGTTEWLLGTETQAWSPPPAVAQNRHRAAGCLTGTWIVGCYTVCGGDAAMEGTCFTVCPETSSIGELDMEVQDVWVYPNPSVGMSVLSTSDGAHHQGWTLLDDRGRAVREGQGSALQTEGLPAGMYFVVVKGHASHRLVVR